MTMRAFAEKPYNGRIHDRFAPLSEEEANAYIADLKNTLAQRNLHPIYRGYCLSLWGSILYRLGRNEEALSKYREAFLLEPSGDRRCNIGAALLRLGRVEEGLQELAQAADEPCKYIVTVLGNLAEALVRVGALPEAIEVFAEAVEIADPQNINETFTLAVQAAELGLQAEAIEFFARFLSLRLCFVLGDERAIDLLLRRQGEYEHTFAKIPKLAAAVRSALAFERAMQAPPDEPPGGSDDALEVFEATRPMRSRAAEAHGRTGA